MSQPDFSAKELADLLWLSSIIEKPKATPPVADAPPLPSSPPPTLPEPIQPPLTSPPPTEAPPSQVPLQAEGQPQVEATPSHRIPFRVPATTALPNRLAFARAIRPLMQRLDSKVEQVLDEVKTAEASAEHEALMVAFQPAKERWFELVLIVDTAPTMLLWYQTAVELQRLLAQTGAFQHVHTYRLETRETVQLRTGLTGRGRVCPPKEITSHTDRRLVLLVSDCTADAWYAGAVYHYLKTWLPTVPTWIVQPLPISLWHSTVLSHCEMAYASAMMSACPNKALSLERPEDWLEEEMPQQTPIPAIPLTPERVQAWARMMVGRGGGQVSAYYLPTPTNLVMKHAPPEEMTPQERWNRFKGATPTARQLASFLAAAPLQLPIMRLVQRVMLPHSHQSHLAEVLRSPLFKPVAFDETIDPDHIQFAFHDGMRDFLRATSFQVHKLKVLKEVSRYIEAYHGQWSGFRAWLDDPTGEFELPSIGQIGMIGESFAEVSLNVVKTFNNKYTELASRLEQTLVWRRKSISRKTVKSAKQKREEFYQWIESSKRKQSMAITPKLLNRLRSTLLKCPVFETDLALSAIFITNSLSVWRDGLPSANSRMERVNSIITFLHPRYDAKMRNALVLFLMALRDNIHPNENLRLELEILIVDLSTAINQTVNSPNMQTLSNIKRRRVLIVAISGGPKPIPAESAIEYHMGQNGLTHCWFIVGPGDDSPMSSPSNAKRIEDELISQGIVVEKWVLQDVDDVKRVFEIIPAIVNEAELKYGLEPEEMIADYTGGTKSLSVGMALGAISTGIDLQYLKPNAYLPDGRTDRQAGSSPRQLNIDFIAIDRGY